MAIERSGQRLGVSGALGLRLPLAKAQKWNRVIKLEQHYIVILQNILSLVISAISAKVVDVLAAHFVVTQAADPPARSSWLRE